MQRRWIASMMLVLLVLIALWSSSLIVAEVATASAQIASCGLDTITLSNADQVTELLKIEAGIQVLSVAFSPDDSSLASANWDGTVRLWESATGTLLSTLEGHSAGVRSVAFSADGTTLASASDDHTVRLWDTTTEVLRATLEGHNFEVNSVAFSPDSTTLASGSFDAQYIYGIPLQVGCIRP